MGMWVYRIVLICITEVEGSSSNFVEDLEDEDVVGYFRVEADEAYEDRRDRFAVARVQMLLGEMFHSTAPRWKGRD